MCKMTKGFCHLVVNYRVMNGRSVVFTGGRISNSEHNITLLIEMYRNCLYFSTTEYNVQKSTKSLKIRN